MSLESAVQSVSSNDRTDTGLLKHLVFYGTILVVLIADQLSKAWVVATLRLFQPTDVFEWLAPILSFTSTRNTGVAFGLFQGMGELFAVFSVLVLIGIFAFRHTLPAGYLWVHVSLGLVVGGAIGNNILDRLLRGHVVDFIDVNFWPFQTWPIFNIADSAIVVGVLILLIDSFLTEMPEASADVI